MIARSRRRRPGAWLVAALVVGLSCWAAATASAEEAPSVDPAPAGGVEATERGPSTSAQARLESSLEAYARALSESDRDARLAGFGRAEQGFAALIEDGHRSAALYTNLGNAALQAEHPGRAVLAYHRALALDPDASTARQNLAHVRTLLPGWVPKPGATSGLESLMFHRRIPPALRSLAAAGFFLIAAACFALSIRRSEGAWRGLGLFAGVLWALLLGSVVLDQRGSAATLAVITADEVQARSADSALSPLALPEPLPAGVEVEALEVRGEWARVRLANGRDVWVRESTLTRVSG